MSSRRLGFSTTSANSRIQGQTRSAWLIPKKRFRGERGVGSTDKRGATRRDEVEVCVRIGGEDYLVGSLHRQQRRGFEAVGFQYAPAWLDNPYRFSIQPTLRLDPAPFAPNQAQTLLGALGDSAPDSWGRSLLLRAERRNAQRENRPVRALRELDFLLGVSDLARVGALRFRRVGTNTFLAPTEDGVPSIVHVRRLLEATERTLLDEETDEDLRIILAPGSSLGGARPKASVLDDQRRLVIAKFPKQTDPYSLERWEAIALKLARRAGIDAAHADLIQVAGKPVLIVQRFDREGEDRVPFLSALAMLDLRDGEQSSYPEMVDAIAEHGAQAKNDSSELFRRMVFNILVSNVDDHMRNHAFLWRGRQGWVLSPAYDLNPTPSDVRPRMLTTAIDGDERTCDVELALSVADFFGLSARAAKRVAWEVAHATRLWRDVAAAEGAPDREIERMSSAFEHEDLRRALHLQP